MRWTDVRWPLSSEQWAGNSQGDAPSEAGYRLAREETIRSTTFSWSASPALRKIFEGLEDQQRMVDHLKRYLEERLAPFQRHVGEHRRHIDQALKHLESRLNPLRQYIEGETQNLDRVTAHLDSGLRDQFDAFQQYLVSQKGLLEEASHYITDQPRPLQTYLEDERQAVEMIYGDLEQRLDRFLQNLSEQHKIFESLLEPEMISEYEALAEYLEEREKAFDRYVRSPEHRPAQLFAQLEEAADRYNRLHPDHKRLFGKVFEETRVADERLREAFSVPRRSLPQEPDGDGHPASSQDNSREEA